jgi:hypothetical protein
MEVQCVFVENANKKEARVSFTLVASEADLRRTASSVTRQTSEKEPPNENKNLWTTKAENVNCAGTIKTLPLLISTM